MLELLHPTALLRLLPPQRGALANAREAVEEQAVAAGERHELNLIQARATGPGSWTRLDQGTGPLHAVHVSTSSTDLVATLAGYCIEGLADDEVCVVALTPEHLAGLRHRIHLAGLSGAAERLLLAVDPATVLARVLPQGRPVAELFQQQVGRTLRRLVALGRPVRALGETAGMRAGIGDLAGAVELEQLWDELQTELGFSSLCAYPPLADDGFRRQVLAGHTHAAVTVG
ncbi:MAG: response regulator [Frankiales bacterium]|nr:response regulator [Frankiales bacterium]